jgi:hypothetical protein
VKNRQAMFRSAAGSREKSVSSAGHLPAAQGGASIAEQILRDGAGTGQFLSETGGTHPW